MRVCPKCGYQDSPHWRTNRWRPHVDYTRLDLFREMEPKMAKELESGRPMVHNAFYTYRLAGKGKRIVERIEKEFYEMFGSTAFTGPFEHFNHMKDPFQKKLFV